MKRSSRLPIASDGVIFIIATAAVTLLAVLLGWERVAALCFLLTVFVVAFFRDPERRIQAGAGEVLSPADGRVLVVESVTNPAPLKGSWQKISIFMSVFNAHINRIPLSGMVSAIRYRPGRFLMGFSEKASIENEQNAIVISQAGKAKLMLVQIAGLIARRIVCHLEEGQEVQIGDRFGLIRFGSRTDVYVPEDAEVLVVKGDRVKAGLDALARI